MAYSNDREIAAWSNHFNKMAQGLVSPGQEYYTLSDPDQSARGPSLQWTYPTSQAVALAETSLNMLQPQSRVQSSRRHQKKQTTRKSIKSKSRKPAQQKAAVKRKTTNKKTKKAIPKQRRGQKKK